MRVLTWNIEWKKAKSKAGDIIKKIIECLDPDIVCLTETYDDFFSSGHVICSHPDYGYEAAEGRRKVLLWSKTPWIDIDCLGSPALPTGRFVAGATGHRGNIHQIIGVCVPWRAAHVTTGRKDRRPWEDHLKYLSGLNEYLSSAPKDNVVLLGDFNQSIPRSRQPQLAYDKLTETTKKFCLAKTAPGTDQSGLIDHIFLSPSLRYETARVIPAHTEALRLSDHQGLFLELTAGKSA